MVYICIIKGITENPKIIYITAIYPYVVLIVFFFRAVTLEGMASGVTHLFKPKVIKITRGSNGISLRILKYSICCLIDPFLFLV